MKIEIKRLDDAFLMEAESEQGNTIRMDSTAESGGSDSAMRPMQVVLAALGGCSNIDVISILKKQKADLRDIHVTVTAERVKDQIPAVFSAIHLHYKAWGNLEAEKIEKAVKLSMEKYCSVTAMLEKTATITYSVEVVNQ